MVLSVTGTETLSSGPYANRVLEVLNTMIASLAGVPASYVSSRFVQTWPDGGRGLQTLRRLGGETVTVGFSIYVPDDVEPHVPGAVAVKQSLGSVDLAAFTANLQVQLVRVLGPGVLSVSVLSIITTAPTDVPGARGEAGQNGLLWNFVGVVFGLGFLALACLALGRSFIVCKAMPLTGGTGRRRARLAADKLPAVEAESSRPCGVAELKGFPVDEFTATWGEFVVYPQDPGGAAPQPVVVWSVPEPELDLNGDSEPDSDVDGDRQPEQDSQRAPSAPDHPRGSPPTPLAAEALFLADRLGEVSEPELDVNGDLQPEQDFQRAPSAPDQPRASPPTPLAAEALFLADQESRWRWRTPFCRLRSRPT
jgi:hypothetical protein